MPVAEGLQTCRDLLREVQHPRGQQADRSGRNVIFEPIEIIIFRGLYMYLASGIYSEVLRLQVKMLNFVC